MSAEAPTNNIKSTSATSIIRRSNDSSLSIEASSLATRKRPAAQQVVEEDTYIQAMSHIIERDFFPDLKKMKLHNGYLSALAEGDVAKARNLGIEIARIKTGKVANGMHGTSASIGM